MVEQQWETALYHGAGEGKLKMAQLALDWAAHLNRPDLVELLSG